MNPEENQHKCAVCREAEPSFIHTVSNSGVFRRLCTDCLLKEHRELFCPVCFNVFFDDPVPGPRPRPRPPQARITCLNCSSMAHLSCSPTPPSSSSSSSAPPPASSFTCPPCSDPNFIFFPKKSRVNDDVSETPLTEVSAMALVAAAKISVASLKTAVAQLKEEAEKKVIAARDAKLKAKLALQHLQDLVLNASQNRTPAKRKDGDR